MEPRHGVWTSIGSRPGLTWNGIGLCLAMALSWLVPGTVEGQAEAAVILDRNPVVAGQAFRITFEFEGADVQFGQPPAIQGLRYLNGPSTTSSTQILNGAVTTKKGFTYTAVAQQPGLIRIPSLEFRSRQGTLLSTEAINLKVLEKGSPGSASQAQFEAVIEVDKRTLHLGEPVRVQYKILNRMDAVDVRNYSFPELAGAWKETVEGEDPRWVGTIIDGRRVQVATVRTDILYPTRTGKLEINGFDVEAQQRVSFFNSRPISASARPVELDVRPLPTPAPTGMLGTFRGLTLTWKTEGNAAPRTNEGINLILEFKGQGNLPLIGEPAVSWPDDLEVFDPEVQDRVTTDLEGQRGRRTLTYLVIPRAPGRFEIGLPAMSYFDHTLDRYVELTTAPIVLEVAGDGGEEGPSFGFNSKTDVTILTRDMRFIRTETVLRPRSRPFFGGPLHMGMWGLPPMGLFMLWLLGRRKEREARDPVRMRRRMAKSSLKEALSQARSGQSDLDRLGQAAHEFLQAQLGLSRSDAGLENYRKGLVSCAPAVAEEWMALVELLDRGRFAPGAPEPGDLARRIEMAARELEKCSGPARHGAARGGAMILLLLGMGLARPAEAAPDAEGARIQFDQGNAAYLEGDFETAIARYEEVALLWSSFELEYNLGVAHYKSGRIGSSILHFERARRIRPNDDDLQANLILARAAVVDRVEAMPDIALGPLWRELTSEHRLVGWTWSSLALWTLAALLFAVRMRSSDIAVRRTMAIVAPTVALTSLLLGFMSRQTHLRSKADDGAVIMAARIEVMSSPGNGPESSKLFVLHEGTVVEVLGKEGEWIRIKLINGNTGWIQGDAATGI